VEASIFTHSLSHSGYNETSEKYEVDKAGLLQQRNYLLPQSINHVQELSGSFSHLPSPITDLHACSD
jgi:hypothetical protein